MDIIQLLADTKIRYAHLAAKEYFRDKYTSKLTVADQGGLWTAGPVLISFLAATPTETVILVDNFDNVVEVNRVDLLIKLREVYSLTMKQWHTEWSESENKR